MRPSGSPTPDTTEEQFAAFDLFSFYHLFRARLWIIMALTGTGLLLGLTYALLDPNVYRASAIVMVEQESPVVVTIQDVAQEDYRQPEKLKTVEQQLATRHLIWRVIQANQLDQTPGFFKQGRIQKLRGVPVSQSDMIDALSNAFTVKLRRGTLLIDIAVTQGNPQVAQTLVRSLIEEYGNQMIEGRSNPLKQANKFLIEESERLKRQVEVSEVALQNYREKNQAVSFEEKQNIVIERLKDLNLRVAKSQNDRVTLESDLAQLDRIGPHAEKLLAIGSIANMQSVLDVRRIYTEKEAAFAMLKQRYGSESSAYVQAERELQLIKATLDKTVLNAVDSLRAAHQAAMITQEISEKMLREQEELALDLNRKAIEYNVLNREVESDRALFESVVKRLKETSVIQNISQLNLRVIEPPMLPEAPESRKKKMIMVMALLGGLGIGCGTVVGMHFMRPSFQTLDDAERALGLRALGLIPRASRPERGAGQPPGTANPHSPIAEAFRFINASVSVLSSDGKRRSLLFTSAAPGDGKTFCAAGYAVALAKSGVRTLLIDADLRHPTLWRIFSLPAASSVGLVECLSGRCVLETAIVETQVDNLHILAGSTAPSDPSVLFAGSAFAALMREAAPRFDQIVIDSAPVTVASETLLMAKEVESTCLVIQASRTPVFVVTRACQLLEMAGGSPLGFILNRVSHRIISRIQPEEPPIAGSQRF